MNAFRLIERAAQHMGVTRSWIVEVGAVAEAHRLLATPTRKK